MNPEEREQRADQDSRARTHLANERTFLAWLRTGIALISLGLAVAQFLEIEVMGYEYLARDIAITMVVTGIIMTIGGCWLYIRHSKEIKEGVFRVTIRIAVIVTGLVALMGLMAAAFILLVQSQ